MKIDYICFSVKNATATRDWFVQKLGFRSVGSGMSDDRAIEIVNAGSIYFVCCAARNDGGAVATFLQHHPPGVSELAFCVPSIEATINHALQQGATLLQPLQIEVQAHGTLQWATLAGWGDLTHTFVERIGRTSLLPQAVMLNDVLLSQPFASENASAPAATAEADCGFFTRMDHVVLNVARGDLERAVAWYERVLGFQPQQSFEIQTAYSALRSRVLRHPLGGVQLPINEPGSSNSQIQEFLDLNRGSGVQHIALETTDLLGTIAHLRRKGLPLIRVPTTYYAQLRQRPGSTLTTAIVQQLEEQQILADWQNQAESAVLLQTFTQPIFEEPTFFLELIQRQTMQPADRTNNRSYRAQGFGEGNFRALFEAIEHEQMKRGSLRR
ncbi:MAG: 4-hydroxyphenylpyruvate dioxygenase [Stenomitos frigidus ULC029]